MDVILERRHFIWLTCVLLLAFRVSSDAAEQPQLISHFDLASAVGVLGPDSGITFPTDALLLISNGRSSPTSVLYDIHEKKVVQTGTTCAITGKSVWATAAGKILSACSDGLTLYDVEFRQIAKFQIHLDYYTLKDTLLLSPTHEFVAFDPLPRHDTAKVLTTATLTEVRTFPSKPIYVEGLYSSGYLVANDVKGKEGSELSFYGFLNAQPVLLGKSDRECWSYGFGISESELLRPSCGRELGKIMDVATAHVRVAVADTESANFVQTSVSGRRFALGFQGSSKSHVVKQLANPTTYIGALGTCCDDPSDLFRLRVYDQLSGRVVAEFHWKTRRGDAMWERYDNSAVAISPSGEYVAFIHDTAIDIYRLPE
jgi:hypothetical protein